jgi:hypothetical protein
MESDRESLFPSTWGFVATLVVLALVVLLFIHMRYSNPKQHQEVIDKVSSAVRGDRQTYQQREIIEASAAVNMLLNNQEEGCGITVADEVGELATLKAQDYRFVLRERGGIPVVGWPDDSRESLKFFLRTQHPLQQNIHPPSVSLNPLGSRRWELYEVTDAFPCNEGHPEHTPPVLQAQAH